MANWRTFLQKCGCSRQGALLEAGDRAFKTELARLVAVETWAAARDHAAARKGAARRDERRWRQRRHRPACRETWQRRGGDAGGTAEAGRRGRGGAEGSGEERRTSLEAAAGRDDPLRASRCERSRSVRVPAQVLAHLPSEIGTPTGVGSLRREAQRG